MLTDTLPEGIQLLKLDSVDKIQTLWYNMSQIEGLFDDFTKGDFQRFIRGLQAPDSIWFEREDGNGVLYLTSVVPGLHAVGHFVYWDKRLRGREESTLGVMRWAMQPEVAGLQKVNCYIPDYAITTRKFAEKLGMKQEGKIRRWSVSNGKLFDMFVYGITKEEAFDGTVHGPSSTDVSA